MARFLSQEVQSSPAHEQRAQPFGGAEGASLCPWFTVATAETLAMIFCFPGVQTSSVKPVWSLFYYYPSKLYIYNNIKGEGGWNQRKDCFAKECSPLPMTQT